MSRLFLFLVTTVIYLSCSNKPAAEKIPSAPASAEDVKKNVTGKKFTAGRTGLASAFANDSSITWMDELKDTSAVFKTFLEGRKKFTLHFVNDSSVQMFDDNKNITAAYKTDNLVGENDKPGIKLRISYLDSANTFGGFGPMMMTYTYIVKGSNEKQLLLETPRNYNNKQVMVLMKTE